MGEFEKRKHLKKWSPFVLMIAEIQDRKYSQHRGHVSIALRDIQRVADEAKKEFPFIFIDENCMKGKTTEIEGVIGELRKWFVKWFGERENNRVEVRKKENVET